MSILDVGKACAQCSTIDYLPFTCPHCGLTFCQAHVQTHGCSTASITREQGQQAGPSTFKRKSTCEARGCERPSIEAIGGKDGESEEVIAREIRCSGCNGAFCTSHRAQVSHDCEAPLEHNARQDAFLERRAKAREIIAAKFPDQKGKVIPKPPPAKDTNKLRPKSPERLPPSLQPPPPAKEEGNNTIKPVVKVKTKAEKVYELELRKLRSLARPLDPKLKLKAGLRPGEEGRRFFQWGVGTGDEVKQWLVGGKVDRKLDKVWVPLETPVGKILDILLVQSKLPRPIDQDPQNALTILCLASPPDQVRAMSVIKTDRPASDLVEGSIVLLVKGWTEPQYWYGGVSITSQAYPPVHLICQYPSHPDDVCA